MDVTPDPNEGLDGIRALIGCIFEKKNRLVADLASFVGYIYCRKTRSVWSNPNKSLDGLCALNRCELGGVVIASLAWLIDISSKTDKVRTRINLNSPLSQVFHK